MLACATVPIPRFAAKRAGATPPIFGQPREVDGHLYRVRGIVEWFGSKIKQYRRVATRYDKKAQNFLAFAPVASIMVVLR